MEEQHIMTAIRAALKAGEQIYSIYENPVADLEEKRKADNSPLTIADRQAHETIVALLSTTPYPILSEEGKQEDYAVRQQWDTLWIVDPLDGTKEFIKRNGEFTVNIALVQHAVPVMGVIYVPVKQVLYFAMDGIGAYKCTDIIRLDDEVTLEQLIEQSIQIPLTNTRNRFVVVASRSHLTPETEAFIDQLKEKHTDIELISYGSSLKICQVAEGNADIYPRFAPTMEWDTAAGHAIARAAGAEIYQVGAEVPLLYNKENLLNPWFIVEPQRRDA